MIKQFIGADRGVAAIDFAIVSIPFFFAIVAIMELSVKSLMQAQLDHQMFDAAMTLSREDDAGISKADYQTNVICGHVVSPMLRCEDILIGAAAFPIDVRFYPVRNDIFVDQWDTGCGGSSVIVELLYPVNHILMPFAVADTVNYNGADYYRSRGVIRREPLLVGTVTGSGDTAC